MRLSYSRLSSWRRCYQRHSWQYIEQRPDLPGLGRVRGDAGHAALAAWYGGESRREAQAKASARLYARAIEGGVAGETLSKEAGTLALVLERYWDWEEAGGDKWRRDAVAVEQHIEIPLFGAHTFHGYVDLVLESDAGPVLAEHKFNVNAESQHVALDAQMGTYPLLYYRATGQVPVLNVHNTIRMREGGIATKEPALRTTRAFTAAGLELAWAELVAEAKDYVAWVERYEARKGSSAAAEMVYRNGKGPNCHWDCGFYTQCLELEQHGDHALLEWAPRPTQLDLSEEEDR